MNQDFKELLLAFNAHNVEYLIVGAHALARAEFCFTTDSIKAIRVISEGYANDHGSFKPLVDKAAECGFQLGEVSADKAYLSGENLLTTLRHKGDPL